MLRASCRSCEIDLDIRVITDPTVRCGVSHFGELIEFTDALIQRDGERLERARARLCEAVGQEGTVRAAAVIGNFQMMNRALDTIGGTLGEKLPPPLRELADELGVAPPPHWR